MKLLPGPTAEHIRLAARTLIHGNLVAFPTETVYGLGGDALNVGAINRIYKYKNRPHSSPLIVHLSSMQNLSFWVKEIPDSAQTLANTFWPGPMTLLMERSLNVDDIITGGQSTIGLRIPSHKVAQELLSEFENLGGLGIAAPSANKYGEVSATSGIDVHNVFGGLGNERDIILDGGICEFGIESTIINCIGSSISILRPGVITPELIEAYTGIQVDQFTDAKNITVPGMSIKHYSPQTRVLINHSPEEGDGLIADFNFITPSGVIRVSAPKNLFEYAKDLYRAFKNADNLKVKRLCVYLPEGNSGIAIAIRDRVNRAANQGTNLLG